MNPFYEDKHAENQETLDQRFQTPDQENVAARFLRELVDAARSHLDYKDRHSIKQNRGLSEETIDKFKMGKINDKVLREVESKFSDSQLYDTGFYKYICNADSCTETFHDPDKLKTHYDDAHGREPDDQEVERWTFCYLPSPGYTLPYLNEAGGEPIYINVRNNEHQKGNHGKYIQPHQKSEEAREAMSGGIFLAADDIGGDKLLITEGEFDALAAYEDGVDAVAIAGVSIDEETKEHLTQIIDQYDQAIYYADKDISGLEAISILSGEVSQRNTEIMSDVATNDDLSDQLADTGKVEVDPAKPHQKILDNYEIILESDEGRLQYTESAREVFYRCLTAKPDADKEIAVEELAETIQDIQGSKPSKQTLLDECKQVLEKNNLLIDDDARNTLEEKKESLIANIDDDELTAYLRASSAVKLANDAYVKNLATDYPAESDNLYELKNQLQKIKEEGRREFYSLYTAGEEDEFKPKLLADDIRQDYDFATVRDSEETLIYRNGYWQAKGETFIEEIATQRLGQEFRQSRVNEVVGCISNDYTERQNFQPPKRKVNLKNGVYDLQDSKLKPHSPEYNFRYKIPYAYREDKDCEAIDEFLGQIVETEDEKQTLYEFLGYTMLPDIPISKALMLTGPGSNGKTIFIDLVKQFVGKKNYTNKGLHDLEREFDIGHIDGSLAVVDDDLGSNKLNRTDLFKQLTGGSDIGAEIKFGDHYDFTPRAKYVFAANQIPPTDDESYGFYRRWIIINFPFLFRDNPSEESWKQKQAVPRQELLAELTSRDEMEGLLSRSVDALQRVLKNDGFTYSPSVEDTRKKWREHSTPVQSFIERFVTQGKTKTKEKQRKEAQNTDVKDWDSFEFDYITKDTMHKMVSAWSKDRGEGRVSKKRISQNLDDSDLALGLNAQTRREPGEGRTRVYSGIRIVLDEADPKTPDYLMKMADSDSSESAEIVDSDEQNQQDLYTRIKELMKSRYSQDSGTVDEIICSMDADDLLNDDDSREDVVTQLELLADNGEIFSASDGEWQFL